MDNQPKVGQQIVMALLLSISTGIALYMDMKVSGFVSDFYTAATGIFGFGALASWAYVVSYMDSDNWDRGQFTGHPVASFFGIFEVPKWFEQIAAFLASLGWLYQGYLFTHHDGLDVMLDMVMLMIGVICFFATLHNIKAYARFAKNYKPGDHLEA